MDDATLSATAAAELLAPFEGFANVPESVRGIAELWIDYTILSRATHEDPALGTVNLEGVREYHLRQRRILALRDQVIEVDTSFTDEELRARFLEEDPALEIRARHILISPHPEATASERDSLRLTLEEIRERIVAGESFEELARAYSVDGSAPQGGDLGFFGRGQMVPEFEAAAFALEPGEVSQVVETPFGFHVIRVDEQRRPDFEAVRERLLQAVQAQARAEAEGEYIEAIEAGVGIAIADSAAEIAEAIAANPWHPLDDEDRALVTWTGGEVTATEIQEYLLVQPREVLEQVRATQGEQWHQLLQNFARQELLDAEADRLGIEDAQAEWELSQPVIRQQAAANAQTMGLTPLEGEDVDEAIQAAVLRALEGNLSGDIGLLPIGPVIGGLRANHEIRLYPEAFATVVERVQAIRSAPGFEPFVRTPPPGGGDPSAGPGASAGPDAPAAP